MIRKTFLIILSVVIIAVIFIRIGYINADKEEMVVDIQNMQQWIALDGNYMAIDLEKTDGYSVKVNEAELYEYSDYLDKYGIDDSGETDISYLKPGKVLELEVVVKNPTNEEGYISLGNWMVMNETLDYDIVIRPELLNYSMPELRDKSIDSVKFKLGSEYVMTLPFLLEDFYEINGDECIFYLYVTRWPERKVVKINLNT